VATTTYNVTVKTPGECAVATGSIEVIVNSSSIAQFSASPEIEMLCAGESADLHVDVQTEIWSDDFDPNISLGDWEDIISGEASAVCGSVSDVGLYFNGVYPRQAITVPMDVSAGGTIYFSLKVANESAPCDDAEVGDNIQLACYTSCSIKQ